MAPELRFTYFLENYPSGHEANINDDDHIFLFTMLFMNGSFFDMAIVPHSEMSLNWVRQYLTESLRCKRVEPTELIGESQPGDECYSYAGAMSVRVRRRSEPTA
jgi:hypothetical protein